MNNVNIFTGSPSLFPKFKFYEEQKSMFLKEISKYKKDPMELFLSPKWCNIKEKTLTNNT
jgi:hypothetical protein